MDTSKYLDFLTQDQIDQIIIEAENDGKNPGKVLGGKYRAAKKQAEDNLQESLQHANQQPEPEDDGFTLQTGSEAATKGAEPQIDKSPARVKEMQDKHREAAEIADRQKENAKRINTTRSAEGRPTRAADIKDSRPQRGNDRVPMHVRNVMTTHHREGYQRRFFNDTEGRIQAALDAGWGFVYKDGTEVVGDNSGALEGGDIGSRVARPAGGGITAYLMEIPQELYEEDQKAKQAAVLATEQDMLPDAARENSESFYTNNAGGKPIVRS